MQSLVVHTGLTNSKLSKGINIMKATEFRIENQNDAEEFENLLDQYRLNHNIGQWPLMKLGDAYTALKRDGIDSRCFTAYLDLYLQDIALQEDIDIIVEELNREYKSGIAEGFFEKRMSRYIASSNAAHRIRAMWDKLMGITVLLNWNDRYDKFCKGKSRLNEYRKIAESWLIPEEKPTKDSEQRKRWEEWNSSWKDEICEIERCVTFISENFRTAEAHQVGRIWKWAFAIQRDEDDPFEELLNSAKDLRTHFHQISWLIKRRSIAQPVAQPDGAKSCAAG